LQRRDDSPARGVILGIRARDEYHVHREANLVALNLDVLLFHQVEQPHLNFLGQVGQLVDRENPAIGARDKSVMDSLLVSEIATLRNLNRIDLANKIRHRDIRRREFFRITSVAMEPNYFRRVALLRSQLHASTAYWRERVVKDLA